MNHSLKKITGFGEGYGRISPIHLGPLRDVFFAKNTSSSYCRSERDIANIQDRTDRADGSAQVALGNIKSVVALSLRPVLSDPFTFS